MSDMFGFDAFSPSQIAQRVDQVGVIKARLPLLSLIMLGLLAGAFIGLGGMCFVLVKSDLSLGFAVGQLLGGMAFCLGLLLVVVAGAASRNDGGAWALGARRHKTVPSSTGSTLTRARSFEPS